MRAGIPMVTVGSLAWGRVVERLCFLFPPVIGVGLIGILQEGEYGVPFLERGLFVIGSTGYALLSVTLAIAIFLDARDVQQVGGWRPNPWLEALFALAWAPAAGVYYVYRRHRQFGTPAEQSRWWIVVAVSLAATLFATATALIAFLLEMPTLLLGAIGLAGTIAFGAFPVAIHQDAAYVCLKRRSWRPNPGFYLGLAFLSLFVPSLQTIVAAYYLYRRWETVGLPPDELPLVDADP